MFGILTRLCTGQMYRFLRKHQDVISGTVGYLDGEGKQEYFKKLGAVVQSCTMPCPIRAMDKGVLFEMELCRHSIKDCTISNNIGSNQHDIKGQAFRRQARGKLNIETLRDIIFTCFIVRCTGNVEHLRQYLMATRKDDMPKSDIWKRLFNMKDMALLPAYIHACARRSGKTPSRSEMSAWLNPQYKTSLPNCCQGKANS
jgi:hypothetical protein